MFWNALKPRIGRRHGRILAGERLLRTTFTRSLLAAAALLPIGLLSLYSFRVTSRAVHELVQANNRSAARITAELVGHDLEASADLAAAFAALPGLVEAVERREERAVRDRLRALVESYARVDRAFVTDREGRLWSDYPPAPESLGRSYSHRDWYRGLSRAWTPYVSEVYQRHAAPRPLVVAIAAPIRRERRVIGALVFQYRLDGITERLKRIDLGRGGYVFVIDQTGTVAAHPKVDLQAREYDDYASSGPILAAMRGESRTAEYRDPLARRAMVATFMPVPVGDHHWTAVAQQPIEHAYAPIRRLGWHIGAAAGILGLAALAVILRLGHISDRNRRLYQELEEHAQALRTSEHRSRQLTEGSLDPIIVADQQGVVTLFNPAAQEIFGYAESEVVGQPLTVLIPPEFRDAHRRGVQRYLRTREPRLIGRTVEVRGQRKDGSVFPLELSLSVLDLPETLVFLGTLRDLTERHRMQARIVQAEKLASLGMLSAGMAHEINNPLAYVANNLAVIQRDTLSLIGLVAIYEESLPALRSARCELAARADQLAEAIDLDYLKANLPSILASTRHGVKRVADIVQSLRDFARLDRAAIDRVDLREAIDGSLELIRGRLSRRNITVESELGDLPPVTCAAVQINQVFLNLLVNAMQAVESSSRGGGRIVIRAWTAGEEVTVEIADDGRGIPPEVLPRIFDPFFTTKAVGEGTGLGLSISHGIVTDHGGRIEVESTPGQGSRFRVILPIGGRGTRDEHAAQALPVGG